MIHVSPQPEPADFNILVRQPGRAFLAIKTQSTSVLASKDYNNHTYWREIIPQLRTAYGGVCAYCCEYIPKTTGHRQVDHFWPKTKKLYQLAYEWTNYRLACGLINGRKGVKTILDPFKIQDGWFIMQFPSLLIIPAPANTLPIGITQGEIQDTIDDLQLNDEGENVPSRKEYIELYCENGDYNYLRKRAPFLAKELARQGIQAVSDVKRVFNI